MVGEYKYKRRMEGIFWSPEQLSAKVKEIKEKKDLSVAMIISLLYLAGARCEEILPYTSYKDPSKNLPSIRWKDIWLEKKKDGREELVISVRVLKTREEKETRRKVFIPIHKNYYAYDLIEVVREGLDAVGWTDPKQGFYEDNYKAMNNNPTPFFDTNTNTFTQIVNKILEVNVHYFRDLRFHDFATIEKLNPFEIQQVGGWKDFQMPFLYSKSAQSEIREKGWKTLEDGK